MAMTANEQEAFDELKAKVKEIREVCDNSLSIQNVGGHHVRNLLIDLERPLKKLEAALNESEA